MHVLTPLSTTTWCSLKTNLFESAEKLFIYKIYMTHNLDFFNHWMGKFFSLEQLINLNYDMQLLKYS